MIKHIDVDSIELNSLRGELFDTVNFYADGFIDLGYITLFASAFPIGPFIGLMMNSLEIRNKLNVFMYVLKRPTCQRCAGIGDWLFIWECFSFISVVNNLISSPRNNSVQHLHFEQRYRTSDCCIKKTIN